MKTFINKTLGRTIDDVLNDHFLASPFLDSNIHEFENYYEIAVAVPGMKKSDLSIQLHNDDTLEIIGNKNEAHHKLWNNRNEFSNTYIRRTFVLPNDVEKTKLTAKCAHGLLEIKIPKTPSLSNRRLIYIDGVEEPKLGWWKQFTERAKKFFRRTKK